MAGPSNSTSKSGGHGGSRPAATTGPLKHLVVDTGAIIKGAGMVLAGRADTFWTVPEVMQEVRDEKARHHLETLPFELRLREPSEEAMRHVVNFARQTGDLRALSKTDLKVLALTYMIEREETGAKHLREAPVRPTAASAAAAVAAKQKAAAAPVAAAAPAALAAASGGNAASANGVLSQEEDSKQFEEQQSTAAALAPAASSSAAAAAAAAAAVAAAAAGAESSVVTPQRQSEAASGGDSGSSSGGDSSSGEEGGDAVVPLSAANGGAEDVAGAVIAASGAVSDSRGVTFAPVAGAAGEAAAAAAAGTEQEEDLPAEESSDEDEDWEPSNDEGSSSGSDESEEEEDDDEEIGDTAAEGGSAAAAAAAPAFALRVDDFPSLGGAPEDNNVFEDAVEDASSVAESEFSPAAAAAAAVPAPKTSWAAAALRNPGPFKPAAAPESDAVVAGGKQQPQQQRAGAGAAAASPAAAAASPAAAAAAAAPAAAGGPDSASSVKSSQASRQSSGAPGASGSRLLGATASNGVWSGRAGDAEDDGVGWVTPGNLSQQRLAGMPLSGGGSKRGGRSGGYGGPASDCRAGCVTGDFAMQNVLLQMGLPLVALDGAVVRRVRQYVLRCAACFKTTTDAEKLFCPVCGSDALERVSCSVDGRTGELRLHLRPNRKPRVRGTKFSLPKPAAPGAKGRFEGDLLLREDQLLTGIWRQKAKRSNKDVKSAFGEELAADVGVRVTRGADVVIGLGKGNPNARRGRERRGKKKASGN